MYWGGVEGTQPPKKPCMNSRIRSQQAAGRLHAWYSTCQNGWQKLSLRSHQQMVFHLYNPRLQDEARRRAIREVCCCCCCCCYYCCCCCVSVSGNMKSIFSRVRNVAQTHLKFHDISQQQQQPTTKRRERNIKENETRWEAQSEKGISRSFQLCVCQWLETLTSQPSYFFFFLSRSLFSMKRKESDAEMVGWMINCFVHNMADPAANTHSALVR